MTDLIPSVFIAAFDATDNEKARADYVLGEHEPFSSALDSLGFVEGRVYFSSGSFCGHWKISDDACHRCDGEGEDWVPDWCGDEDHCSSKRSCPRCHGTGKE